MDKLCNGEGVLKCLLLSLPAISCLILANLNAFKTAITEFQLIYSALLYWSSPNGSTFIEILQHVKAKGSAELPAQFKEYQQGVFISFLIQNLATDLTLSQEKKKLAKDGSVSSCLLTLSKY